jgi:hypothetical protein
MMDFEYEAALNAINNKEYVYLRYYIIFNFI